MSHHDHQSQALAGLTVAVLSISSTRSLDNDKSGHWIGKRARKEGHRVVLHEVVPDDMASISRWVRQLTTEGQAQAILITGGTGVSEQDVTIEAVRPLFRKELTAFGALFAQLSYEQVDSAALLSRATAGIIGRSLVFCMPGSLKACQLACKALIFPELGHLMKHVVSG